MSDQLECMAQSQNSANPPSAISIPSILLPIIEAFSIESEVTAKALIRQSINMIYSQGTYEDVETIFNLMKAISPKDTLEIIYAAQIVLGYLLGMHKFSLSYPDDQILGLKLLKFSNDAMDELAKRRSKGVMSCRF